MTAPNVATLLAVLDDAPVVEHRPRRLDPFALAACVVSAALTAMVLIGAVLDMVALPGPAVAALWAAELVLLAVVVAVTVRAVRREARR
ncbi:MAG: hypothetical protein ACRCZP_11010 [Phycicoccus sp.]